MSARSHQLQWRARPDGVWTFHSKVEMEAANEKARLYHGRHGDKRIFDYRVVEAGSRDALAPIEPPVFQ